VGGIGPFRTAPGADGGLYAAAVPLMPGYETRPLTIDDAPALADAYGRNRAHLAPWEPSRKPTFFTEAGQRSDTAAKLESAAAGHQDPWVLWHGDVVVGRVNLSNIARGPFQSASLGYWVDHEHTGRGLATAAVGFAVERARHIGLHRVEAGTLLHNAPSQVVLRRCGFEEFGRASSYLFIAGAWQDHVMFQRILHDDPLG
jgi:[ribosomal protein S5]-alanine N-acetyltransferase